MSQSEPLGTSRNLSEPLSQNLSEPLRTSWNPSAAFFQPSIYLPPPHPSTPPWRGRGSHMNRWTTGGTRASTTLAAKFTSGCRTTPTVRSRQVVWWCSHPPATVLRTCNALQYIKHPARTGKTRTTCGRKGYTKELNKPLNLYHRLLGKRLRPGFHSGPNHQKQIPWSTWQ